MNFVQVKPSTPASSLNSRCMASSGVSSAMLSPILPPTPLSSPCCHSGFDLRMRTTFESVGSSIKPTQYLVFFFPIDLNTPRDAVRCVPDFLRREFHDAIDAVRNYADDACHPAGACAHRAIEAVHDVTER